MGDQIGILVLLKFYGLFWYYKFFVSRILTPEVQQALLYAQGTCHHHSTLLSSRSQGWLEMPVVCALWELFTQKNLKVHSRQSYNVLVRQEEKFEHLYPSWIFQSITQPKKQSRASCWLQNKMSWQHEKGNRLKPFSMFCSGFFSHNDTIK